MTFLGALITGKFNNNLHIWNRVNHLLNDLLSKCGPLSAAGSIQGLINLIKELQELMMTRSSTELINFLSELTPQVFRHQVLIRCDTSPLRDAQDFASYMRLIACMLIDVVKTVSQNHKFDHGLDVAPHLEINSPKKRQCNLCSIM